MLSKRCTYCGRNSYSASVVNLQNCAYCGRDLQDKPSGVPEDGKADKGNQTTNFLNGLLDEGEDTQSKASR